MPQDLASLSVPRLLSRLTLTLLYTNRETTYKLKTLVIFLTNLFQKDKNPYLINWMLYGKSINEKYLLGIFGSTVSYNGGFSSESIKKVIYEDVELRKVPERLI